MNSFTITQATHCQYFTMQDTIGTLQAQLSQYGQLVAGSVKSLTTKEKRPADDDIKAMAERINTLSAAIYASIDGLPDFDMDKQCVEDEEGLPERGEGAAFRSLILQCCRP